ncbi:L-glutamate gamma-semialdehyde dehydrogenase [bacterium]|nr:L-glutamate gamma-semialdehyde dehydrogenase [bacterium]
MPSSIPQNEPVRNYAPGESPREKLKARLKSMSVEKVEIPCFIGGKEVRTGQKRSVVMPHSHKEVVAEAHFAGPEEIQAAAEAALKGKSEWEAMSPADRSSIFLKAADLLAGPHRDHLNAATMLGQSKSAYQAEIDSACELIDFLRFNAYFYQQIQEIQPLSVPGVRNQLDYRPLEGFVFAITPFNFTAIAGNLPAAPAIMGNTVVWKPSDTQLLSAYHTMRLFKEAGLPDGVINMIPAEGPMSGQVLLNHPDLAGVHFTGSTGTFNHIFKTIGSQISRYRSYPRIVGETGGKGFVFAHPSANVDALATALVRGAFEFQGQKCSAASRAYIPRSLWPKVQEKLIAEIQTIKVGDVRDFRNFMNAVIDERAFKKITGYIDLAKASTDAKILTGGTSDSKKGYFIDPTVILAADPSFKTMAEEIFGPVLSVFVYQDNKLEETLTICDQTSPYALTGAIFSEDRTATVHLSARLRNTAGNFYINDKPTGAVVGQQPFAGSRASGTNDKAGSMFNLLRWTSIRTIKETSIPAKDYRYPFLGAE